MYTFISCGQNEVQIYNIIIGNKRFSSVGKFKYSGTTLQSQNCINEKLIKPRDCPLPFDLNPLVILIFIGPYIIVIFEEQKTNFLSLVILFHFLCAQHVSDINISIIRTLRLFCSITTLVVLFLVRCVLEIRCDWVGVVSVLR